MFDGSKALKLLRSKSAALVLVAIFLATSFGTLDGIPAAAQDDGKFTIAIIPDTQSETTSATPIQQQWFKNRAQWLAANKASLNLNFVLHTGDMMNFPGWEVIERGTDTQLTIASQGMAELDNANIPYLIAIGNHDNCATKEGGSAWNPNPMGFTVNQALRYTVHYNQYFPTSRFPGIVQFESGKSENAYRTFEAGGKKWLAMVLEFCPRAEVVRWAKDVVAFHPDHNVLIATHSYLEANGSISSSNSGYGDTSPQYVFENLIKLYPNVKFVFSGHTGSAAYRQDTGEHGNKIISILGAFHHGSTNPVQLLEIDTSAGTARNWYYGPINGMNVHSGWTFTGLNYVSPNPGATPTPKASPYPTKNAFANPGFEHLSLNVTRLSTGVAATRDTAVKHSGVASLKAAKTGAPASWPYFEVNMDRYFINWQIGATYGWAYRVYSAESTQRNIAGRVRWANSEGGSTDFYQIPNVAVGGGAGWEISAGTFTIPSNANISGDVKSLKLYINAGNVENYTFYLDDLYICRLTESTQVASSWPAQGATVNEPVDYAILHFNYPIRPSTLTTSNISVTGAQVSAIELPEGSHTATIRFAQPVTSGSVSIGLTSNVKDLFGRSLTPTTRSFTVNATVPTPSPTPTPPPSTPTPPPVVMQNAFTDPGLESGNPVSSIVTKVSSNVTVSRDTSVKRRGNASLKMAVGSPTAYPYFEVFLDEDAFEWVPGQQYGWSYWAYSPSSTEITLNNRFRHNLNQESGSTDYAQAPFQIKVGAGRGWENYAGVVTLSPSAIIQQSSGIYGTSKSYIQSGSIGSVDVYYDDMYFYQLTGPTAVVSSAPADGAVVNGPVSSIDITFNYPIRPSTFTTQNITIDGAEIADIELPEGSHTATIYFEEPLEAGGVIISLSDEIKDLFGRSLTPKAIGFAVSANAFTDPGLESGNPASSIVTKVSANVTMSRDTSVKRNGSASLKMAVGSPTAYPYFEIFLDEDKFDWAPGQEYGWSYWAYSPSSTEITLNNRFRHNLNQESGSTDFAQAPHTIKVGGGRGWENYAGVVTLSPSAIIQQSTVYGTSKSYIQSGSIGNVDVYYDDMYFYQLNGPTKVVSSTPASGGTVGQAVSSVQLVFNYPIRPSTLTTGNISVTGAAIANINITEGSHTAVINFSQPVTSGTVTLNLSSNIKDLFGRDLTPKTITFTVNS